MSGFDAEKLNAAFFPDGKWKVKSSLQPGLWRPNEAPRAHPRLNFEEASVILYEVATRHQANPSWRGRRARFRVYLAPQSPIIEATALKWRTPLLKRMLMNNQS